MDLEGFKRKAPQKGGEPVRGFSEKTDLGRRLSTDASLSVDR